MGQSVTTEGNDENLQETNTSTESDFQFLIGKLENLPDSARKLFSLSKQYLTTGSSGSSGEKDDFCALFHEYQPVGSGDPSDEQKCTASQLGTGMLDLPLRKSAPLHRFQTYVQWKAAQDLNNFYSLCLPKRHTIYLQPVDTFPNFVQSFRFKSQSLSLNLFETIQAFLQIFFYGEEVLLLPPVLLENSADVVRSREHPVTGTQQVCLTDLYPLLQRLLPPNGICVLGISWTDLYPEGHNFALGEASVQHTAAVVSFGRFETKGFNAETHSDINEIDGSVVWKLIKSSSHELCHLLGLHHCTFFRCAMNESSCVAEAMDQPLFLCPVCLRKLQRACGFDVLERYVLLQKFLSSLVDQFPGESKLQETLVWLEKCILYLNS